MTNFVRVASTNDLAPGEMMLVELKNELICLANVNGQYYAISDDCSHVGGALSEGELEGYIVTCPMHAGQFDVRTGKVVRRPPREDVATFAVKVEGEDIFVATTPNP